MKRGKQPVHTIASINVTKRSESRLTALRFVDSIRTKPNKWYPNGSIVRMVECECFCSKRITLTVYKFLKRQLSCGCISGTLKGLSLKRYNGNNRGISSSYQSMIRRCYDTKHPSYKSYGGRGVTVCKEWRDSYQTFLDWANNNGWQLGLQIDKDILGNGLTYSPSTCKWVTRKENCNNKASSKKFNYNGASLTLTQISDLTGLSHSTLTHRIYKMKLSLELAFSPVRMNRLDNFKKNKTK